MAAPRTRIRPRQPQPLHLAQSNQERVGKALEVFAQVNAAEFVTHEFPIERINDALAAVKSG